MSHHAPGLIAAGAQRRLHLLCNSEDVVGQAGGEQAQLCGKLPTAQLRLQARILDVPWAEAEEEEEEV